MITVYGRPGCMSCEVKKIELSKQGIDFEYVDVDDMEHNELLQLVARNDGISALPIVEGE